MESTSTLAASSRPRSAGGAVGGPDEQDASTVAAINAAATLSFRVIMKS